MMVDESKVSQKMRQYRSGSIFSTEMDDETDWNDLFTRMRHKEGNIDDFKKLMYKIQRKRREFVIAFLRGCQNVQPNGSQKSVSEYIVDCIHLLQKTHAVLSDSNDRIYQKEIFSTSNKKLSLNVKDEILGIQKDLVFLDKLHAIITKQLASPSNDESRAASNIDVAECLVEMNFLDVLAPYHPVSADNFIEEHEGCVKFLRSFIALATVERRKPIIITDWDGTMKDYCSQYATNLQPIYTALSMAKFSETYTRLTAVLTAGPLRGPGILDLTSLPKDGPIVFGGSWGREWWLGGKRIVHDEGISDEGLDALERLSDEMNSLLSSQEFSHFGLIGSGFQRKVDRLTMGVQTVCKHVNPDLSARYQEQVKERLHRVDPNEQVLHFEPSTGLEIEVVVHSDGIVWNKANGVARLIETIGDTLEHEPVLVCGDTFSDIPMVLYAVSKNSVGSMALFVTSDPKLRERVGDTVGDMGRCCFVSTPDVIHAAMMTILTAKEEAISMTTST